MPKTKCSTIRAVPAKSIHVRHTPQELGCVPCSNVSSKVCEMKASSTSTPCTQRPADCCIALPRQRSVLSYELILVPAVCISHSLFPASCSTLFCDRVVDSGRRRRRLAGILSIGTRHGGIARVGSKRISPVVWRGDRRAISSRSVRIQASWKVRQESRRGDAWELTSPNLRSPHGPCERAPSAVVACVYRRRVRCLCDFACAAVVDCLAGPGEAGGQALEPGSLTAASSAADACGQHWQQTEGRPLRVLHRRLGLALRPDLVSAPVGAHRLV
ncbi:hypothetical protein EJ03DRAFT_22215 [Teratosphaeria nubilosa]|uniref:Uncharacterized protein n=1 Tax=Teratosphaeria nubilosa TaxID=161662 RepID=A0A6G1LFI0_9PEZI|nr:hypothetical protein EJ03DRAFT_22215 [Teratosphaeria nubilosa]